MTSLYQPLSFENNDFWFTCKKEEPALGLEKLISPVNSAYNKIKVEISLFIDAFWLSSNL